MAKQIEIHIIGSIPDGNDELGHEAVVATKDLAIKMVETLKELGVTDAKCVRRLVGRRDKPASTGLRAVPPAA